MMKDPLPRAGRRVTRKDVAERAGVSDAVVSYTLNGGAPVAAATAERVMAAIEQLGYRPNLTARALKSGSARAFALLAPAAQDPILTNPFFMEFASAVEASARERGYALFMASSPAGPDGLLKQAMDFASRQVDGLLIVPSDVEHSAGLDGVGIPWVQLNTAVPIDGLFSVGADLYDGAFQATSHLLDHGHTSIAFVGEGGNEARARGWRDACQARNVAPGPVIASGYGRDDGYFAGLDLLRSSVRPTAAFTASDLIAIGVLRAAHEHGVSVPDQLALASFDGSWESNYTWPRLTTVRQPIEDMAESAIAMLLQPPAGAARHRVFTGTLMVRESCGGHSG